MRLERIYAQLRELRDLGAKVSIAGYSTKGNPIPWIELGKRNSPRVMIVACQHGSEPTGTVASLKLIRDYLAYKISIAVSVGIIPVANPDGAQRFHIASTTPPRVAYKMLGMFNLFIGRTVGIINGDLNRDHEIKKYPETQTIEKLIDSYNPDYLVDLHNFPPEYNLLYQKRTKLRWHDFCAIVPNIGKRKIRKVAREMAIMACEGAKKAGGNPMKINGITDAFIYRRIKYLPIMLDSWSIVYRKIPSITLEAWGGFHTGARYIQHGAKLHYAAIYHIIKWIELQKNE